MLRKASRLLLLSSAAYRSRSFSTSEVIAGSSAIQAFEESWAKSGVNMKPLKTPQFFMKPRPPIPSSIPSKLTVNFVLPYSSEISSMEVEMVMIPALSGQMGILAGHVPTIAELKPGVVAFHEGKDITKYFVAGGFAFVHANSVTDIVANEAVKLDQLDPARISAGITEFNGKTRSAKTDLEKAEAQIGVDMHAALDFAVKV